MENLVATGEGKLVTVIERLEAPLTIDQRNMIRESMTDEGYEDLEFDLQTQPWIKTISDEGIEMWWATGELTLVSELLIKVLSNGISNFADDNDYPKGTKLEITLWPDDWCMIEDDFSEEKMLEFIKAFAELKKLQRLTVTNIDLDLQVLEGVVNFECYANGNGEDINIKAITIV